MASPPIASASSSCSIAAPAILLLALALLLSSSSSSSASTFVTAGPNRGGGGYTVEAEEAEAEAAAAAAAQVKKRNEEEFVRVEGAGFVVRGHPLYVNGFNAYYLAYTALDSPSTVTGILQQAAAAGLTLCRTWAFNDATYHALQLSPGHYDQHAFQGLDFVLAEARRLGIRLILSLANNYPELGGKATYVQWARNAGAWVASEDDFFTHPLIKAYYKEYVEYVLTRVNTITGVTYKDDPTIFAWELMNEPRCPSDQSGDTLHAWISEMSSFIKSLDGKHMVEAGLEGWYGASSAADPNNNHASSSSMMAMYTGTDFVRFRDIPTLDFTTVHSYPDMWLSSSSFPEQLQFLQNWVEAHIRDAGGKPVLFSEFGYSSRNQAYTEEKRGSMFAAVYGPVYASAMAGGAAAGALVWQLCTAELEATMSKDGYGVVLSAGSPVTMLLTEQSQKLSALSQ